MQKTLIFRMTETKRAGAWKAREENAGSAMKLFLLTDSKTEDINMKKFEFIVKEKVGIHAIPATRLVKAVSEYKSNIHIEKNGKIADAKNLMEIMSLGVRCGEKIILKMEGPDEDKASIELKNFCEKNL